MICCASARLTFSAVLGGKIFTEYSSLPPPSLPPRMDIALRAAQNILFGFVCFHRYSLVSFRGSRAAGGGREGEGGGGATLGERVKSNEVPPL